MPAARRTFLAEFGLGEVVFHRCAEQKSPGIITAVVFYAAGSAMFQVSWGDCSETRHYGIELTREFQAEFGAIDE